MKNDWKTRLRRRLARLFGYVLVSDYVTITVELTSVPFQPRQFNPDLIIGKRDLV